MGPEIAPEGPGLEVRVRRRYREFATKMEKGDPSFLAFVHPSFVYIGPHGERQDAKQWSDGMRQACQVNRGAHVKFRLTEIKPAGAKVRVSYVWTYRFKDRRGTARMTESISTDTWQLTGSDLKLVVSKDFRIWTRLDTVGDPTEL